MDTRESNLAWWIAGILLVLLIIVGYLWISQKQSLPTVLQNGKTAIQSERDQIAADCANGQANSTACQQDITDLKSTLVEFSANIETASTSTTTGY